MNAGLRGRLFRRAAPQDAHKEIPSDGRGPKPAEPPGSAGDPASGHEMLVAGAPLTDSEWQEVLRCAGGIEAKDRPGFVVSVVEARRSLVLLAMCWVLLLRSACPPEPPPIIEPMASCPGRDAPHCVGLQGIDALWWGQRLDLNTATAIELQVVAGVGRRLAARIVADRSRRGPYCRMAEVERVRGVGPKLRRKMAALVEVRDLNCASDLNVGEGD